MTENEDDDDVPRLSERDETIIQPDEVDPEQVKLHFTKQKRDGEQSSLPDGYVEANKREVGNNEQLSIVLTMEQAQGWADTLGAKLIDYRKQIQDSVGDVDELYLIRKTREFGVEPKEVDSVAITKHAAYERRSEIEHENPTVEVEIDTIPLHTE